MTSATLIKLKKCILLSVFIGFIFLFLAAGSALAFEPQVKIPGLDNDLIQPGGTTKPIGEYVKAIYVYATGVVGILAAVVMMFGGIVWITAFGNSARIGEAKAWITAALTGLILALTSYMILATVNPALVNLQTNKIPTAQEVIISAKQMKEMKAKCEAKCGTVGYFYDGLIDQCVCMGTGSHAECVMEDSISGPRTPTCQTVNWEGTNQCDISDPNSCITATGCCICSGLTWGLSWQSKCTAGLNMTNAQTCDKLCGWAWDSFTQGAICAGSVASGWTCEKK